MKRLNLIEPSIPNANNTNLNRIIFSYKNLMVKVYSYIRFKIIPLRFLQEIIQYIPETGKVLDLGCGFGLFSLYFAKNRPDVNFTGFDLVEKRIQLANSSAKNLELTNINFKTLDVRQLNPLPGEKFDTVISMDVLHHISVEEGNLLLQKIARDILKPGGIYIIKDVTTKPRPMIWFTFIMDLLMNPRDSFFYRDVSAWKSELLRAGFSRIEEHYLWDILPYPHILLVAYMPEKQDSKSDD